MIRAAVVVVMIASYVLAVLYRGDLVRLLLYAYGPIAQFAPAVAATLYLERVRGPAVLSGLVAGSVVATACVVWPDARPFPLHAGIYGLLANLLVLAIVSVLDSRPASKAERNFLGHASGALGADPPFELVIHTEPGRRPLDHLMSRSSPPPPAMAKKCPL